MCALLLVNHFNFLHLRHESDALLQPITYSLHRTEDATTLLFAHLKNLMLILINRLFEINSFAQKTLH